MRLPIVLSPDSIFISVIIPLFNGAQYIQRSVRSVLSQTHSNFELIVVDDGSTDGGGALLQEFIDPRLRVVWQENAGVSAARNRGIEEGKGEFLAFLDADDEWNIDFLNEVAILVTRYPKAGIYGAGRRIVSPNSDNIEVTAAEALSHTKDLLITDYLDRMHSGSLIHASGVMIPRSIFDELGTFKVGVPYGEDIEMWARISLRYPIAYSTRILFSFHETPLANKPRSIRLPEFSPYIRLLQEALKHSDADIRKQRRINTYIRKRLMTNVFYHIANSGYTQTISFMERHQAVLWIPMLDMLIRIPGLRLLLRIAALIYRFPQSKLYIIALGGHKKAHGVLIRLTKR